MERAVIAVAAILLSSLLGACDPPQSERWQRQLEQWPEDVPMGGTPAERRQYVEGEESFEAMIEADNEMAEH